MLSKTKQNTNLKNLLKMKLKAIIFAAAIFGGTIFVTSTNTNNDNTNKDDVKEQAVDRRLIRIPAAG